MKKSFGDRLKSLRQGATQAEFAQKIGTKQTTYSSWENGAKEPSFSTVRSICQLCGVSSDWLLGISDATQQPAALSLADAPTPYTTKAPSCPECLRMRSDLDRAEGRIEELQHQTRELLDRLSRPISPGIHKDAPGHTGHARR